MSDYYTEENCETSFTGKVRSVVFTSFAEQCPKYKDNLMKYLVFGEEICPTTGKRHWQGYMELKNAYSWKKVHEALSNVHGTDKIWCFRRNGTAKQASDYCKKDGKFQEFGTISQQGARNDLALVAEAIKAGSSISEVALSHPEQYIKYHAGIDKLSFLHSTANHERWRNVEVHVYWGPPGTGKTRRAYEENPELFDIVMTGSEKMWFDGYQGEPVLLLDEMSANAVNYQLLLRLLDGYPMRLPVKGAFINAKWTKVIITSNKAVESWFPNERDHTALLRRITTITYMTEGSEVRGSEVVGNISTTTSVIQPRPPRK